MSSSPARVARAAHAAPAAKAPTDDAAAQRARVLQRFRQVFTATRAHYQLVEKQVGLGGAQVWALGIVGAHPGIGVGALARALHVHQSTASNLVRNLVERGLLSTTRGRIDRRSVELRLLAPGRELLARVPGPATGLLVQALEGLDRSTLARMEADLTQLIGRMGIGPDAPATPIAQL